MIKRIFLVMVICFMGVAALAENWKEGSIGIEYNCDLLGGIAEAFQNNDANQIETLSTQTLVRTTNTEVTVATYFGITQTATLELNNRQAALLGIVTSACDPVEAAKYATTLFNVQIDDGANIRSCASTDCEIVRLAEGGEMLSVVGIKGDWYEVRNGNTTAFIASFLVRKVMCL